MIVGHYLGFCLAEFSQESQTTVSIHDRAKGGDGSPKTFTFDDVFFYYSRTSRRTLTKEQISHVTPENPPMMVTYTWKYQKNGQNGEQISLVCDNKTSAFCPVRASVCIMQRAIRNDHTSSDQPLGMFIQRHRPKFLTGDILRRKFQLAAKVVENIDDPDLLSRFSAHSIRVTAANLLHRAGKDEKYIQKRLCWLSLTFMMYLRNTIQLAEQHTLATQPSVPLEHLLLHPTNVPSTL